MHHNSLTIQETKELMYTYTSPTSGRPSPDMTDKQWQHKFQIMRSIAEPVATHRIDPKYEMDHYSRDELGNIKYDGKTIWQSYCNFCNDVLSTIRTGQIDYCYFTYQISTLLKYEPKRLRSKYCPKDEYWQVWLEDVICG